MVGDTHLHLAFGSWLEALVTREDLHIDDTLFWWYDDFTHGGVDLSVRDGGCFDKEIWHVL